MCIAAMLAVSGAAVFLLAGFGGRCSLLAATGRPCWFCGCTRDWLLLLHGHAPVHNPLSVFYAGVFSGEFAWRTAGAVWGWRGRALAAADVAMHVVLAAVWAVLLWRCRG